jgi:CheY-like chemotaxis protein
MNQDEPELLLFDDEPDTAEVVVDRLSDDFKVTFCSTETQLRDTIEPDRFCVIVCDVSIQSSNKTGYEIIDEIREEYGIRKTPVGVYSAVRNIPEIQKSQGPYYDFYIEKAEGWSQKLLAECIKACAKEGRLVLADVMERKLKDHLDDLLDVTRYSPDAEILGVHSIPNLTVKIALEQLRKKELDKETESVYTTAIEKFYGYIREL